MRLGSVSQLFRVFMLFGCVLCMQACSATNSADNSMPSGFTVQEIALYMSRASMNSVDFEQYKVTPKRIYQECGVIRRGRHVPTHQQLFDLSDNLREAVMSQTWQVLEAGHGDSAQFEGPGSGDTLFDPGRLHLQIKGNQNKFDVKTSVDGISDPVSGSAKAVLELVRLIRAFTKPGACGNPSFYGVGFAKD